MILILLALPILRHPKEGAASTQILIIRTLKAELSHATYQQDPISQRALESIVGHL